jgi:WD40 repeat protein
MKKVILSIAFGLGVVGNLMAMEPTYAEATAGRPVISSGNAGQESGEEIVTSEVEVKPVAEEPMVKFITSDNQERSIPLSEAKKIPVVNLMLEDIDEEHQIMAIPLSNVDGKSLKSITNLLIQKKYEYEVTENDFKDFTVDDVINLINATEYLDLEILKATLFKVLSQKNVSVPQLTAMSSILLKQFWLHHPAYHYFFAPKAAETLHSSGGIIFVSPHGDKLASTFLRNSPLNLWIVGSPVTEQFPVFHARPYFIANKIVAPVENEGIGVWDLDNFEQSPYVVPTAFFSLNTVSSDETKLITWSPGVRGITVWNLENLDEEPWELDERFDNVIASARSLIAWDDQTIKIWNINDLEQKPYKLSYQASSVSVSADGNTLIAWSYNNGTIRVWDMNQLEKGFYDLEHERVNSVHVGVGSHRNIVVSAALSKNSIKIWDLNNPDKLVRELRNVNISGFFITNDRLIVFSVEKMGYVDIYDLNNLDQVPYRMPFNKAEGVMVSADGSTLVVSFRQSIELYKLLPISEFSKLNLDQITFLIWLYGNRNVQLPIVLTDAHKSTYQTLSNNLKELIQNSFPRLKAQLIQPQKSEVQEQSESMTDSSSSEEELLVPVRASRRSRFFDKFKRSKK